MTRVVEGGYAVIRAVDRERVLGQVVRSDREKIQSTGKDVGHNGRCRHLDHATHQHGRIKGLTPQTQRRAGIV